MIRFVLKSAFLLGVVAMFLPAVGGARQGTEADTSIDVFAAVSGAQAAIADVSGFCGRAPAACAAGGDLARFAAQRIGDGLALAYDYVETDEQAPVQAVRLGTTPSDAILTGAIVRAVDTTRPPSNAAPAKLAMPGMAAGRTAVEAPRPPAFVPGAVAARSVPLPRPRPNA